MSRPRTSQHGFALVLTMIVMVLMMLGTMAVVRSTQNAGVISGNFAFKQAAVQVSDRGVTDAFNYLANLSDRNVSQINRYASLRDNVVDAQGVPSAINWANVECRDPANGLCDSNTDYRVQNYIERQCASTPTLADPISIKAVCDFEVVSNTPEVLAILYRVIVRVEGPRGTVSMVEVMVSGPP